jgi:hypothetical protein
MTLRVFIGVDPRQPVGFSVLASSLYRHSSLPVSITPLVLRQLPLKRRGLTDFTYSRFLVPYLCGFRGSALFLDADMVMRGDIAELFYLLDTRTSVQVNKEQPEFEWASAMLFNCANCELLTPAYVEDPANAMFDMKWADHGVGSFPKEFNHCVRYAEPNPNAKLFHYTEGLPCWVETSGACEDVHWEREHKIMNSTVRWQEMMGNSVHAQRTMERLKNAS